MGDKIHGLARIILFLSTFVFFIFSRCDIAFSDNKNIKANELMSYVEIEMKDVLSKIESNSKKTIVLIVPDESGFVIIEPWTTFIDNQSRIKAVEPKEIERKIISIYKKGYYDTYLLKVSPSVSYEYLYNLIHRIEEALIKNRIFGNKKLFERPRYIFEKPLLEKDVTNK